jgi:type IV secretory pathway component VirB8
VQNTEALKSLSILTSLFRIWLLLAVVVAILVSLLLGLRKAVLVVLAVTEIRGTVSNQVVVRQRKLR